MTDGKTLKDQAFYILEFDFPGSPRGVERIVARHVDGRWLTTSELDYEDDPLPVALAGHYRVVRQVDLWSA